MKKTLRPLIFAAFVLALAWPYAAARHTAAQDVKNHDAKNDAQGIPPHVTEVEVSAKKYSFSPDTIRVKKGDRVKLVITATDRDHGIKLEAFHVEQKLKKDVPATVEFVADKAGTFSFKCSVFCGVGHGGMKGKLIVEE